MLMQFSMCGVHLYGAFRRFERFLLGVTAPGCAVLSANRTCMSVFIDAGMPLATLWSSVM